jgi:hypothetical protein
MSSKKPFDYIEDKIKQAAENSLPPFDEKAWEAMNAKLDQEEKRRKPFFLWWIILPLLLIGGLGAYKLFSHSNSNHTETVTIATTTDQKQQTAEQLTVADGTDKTGSTDVEQKSTAPINDKNSLVKKEAKTTTAVNKKNTLPVAETATIVVAEKRKLVVKGKKGKLVVSNTAVIAQGDEVVGSDDKTSAIDNKFNRKIIKVKRPGKASVATAGNAAEEEKDETTEANNVQSPTVIKTKNAPSKDPFAAIKSAPKSIIIQQKETEISITNDAKDKEKTVVTEKGKVADQQKDKQKNVSEKGFYLLATAGPDAGSVKLFSYANSSVTPRLGIGAGYQFNNRLSVQTGFYAVNKKYVAFKGDYHAKPGSYWDRVDIQKVKAACLIYEIPLTVRYDLVRRKSLNFYATAGMSSYIMQKENYDYYYNAYNAYHEKEVQYTGNKNFFSTLSFSVGLEKKLTPAFSLLLEPSVSLPVTGVGDGKVRLYSSALQLGARYFFPKSKK